MTLQDILKKYHDNCEIKSFADVIEQSSAINREIMIYQVDEELASGIELMIRFWNNIDAGIPAVERKPIKIFIDSLGGSVTAGFTIIDAIKMSITPVYTIVVGSAYSMGLEIAIAGHKRFCYKNATYLFHEGSIGLGSVDANKFKNFAEFYKKQIACSKEMIILHTNITEEWYKEHQNDDVWLFAEEAKELNMVDEIVEEFIF